jgi:hypothetical protein
VPDLARCFLIGAGASLCDQRDRLTIPDRPPPLRQDMAAAYNLVTFPT